MRNSDTHQPPPAADNQRAPWTHHARDEEDHEHDTGLLPIPDGRPTRDYFLSERQIKKNKNSSWGKLIEAKEQQKKRYY